MVALKSEWHREDQIAQLTEAAYRAVLAHGYRGSFVELELSLWNAIRQGVERIEVVHDSAQFSGPSRAANEK